MQKFSKEIAADEDAYYMSCPEYVAEFIKDKIDSNNTVVELCSAVGISSIIIARKAHRVYGVDIDSKRIEYARKNAKLYNVSNVEFILGNVLDEELLKSIKADVALLDPDWSVDKNTPQVHGSDLSLTVPSAIELFNVVKNNITNNIILRVSKNVDNEELIKLGKCTIYNIYYDDRIHFKYAIYNNDIVGNSAINVYFSEGEYREEKEL